MERVDFHVHYDPLNEETAYRTIDLAAQGKVVAISLMAKGVISSNYHQFIEYGKCVGVEVVPGVEQMVRVNGKRTDVVCLGFDPIHLEVRRTFGKGENRNRNKEIAQHQEKFLAELGFSFANLGCENTQIYDEIMNGNVVDKAFRLCKIVSSSEDKSNASLISEIISENFDFWTTVLGEYGHLPSFKDDERSLMAKFLYCLYFAVDRPGYLYVQNHVGPIQLSAGEVVEVVHNAGGVVLYSPEGRFDYDIWKKLRVMGVDGLMAWHGGRLGQSGIKPDTPASVVAEARRDGLLILGGSDHQGDDWQIGAGNGSMYISPRRYKELSLYISSKNGKEV